MTVDEMKTMLMTLQTKIDKLKAEVNEYIQKNGSSQKLKEKSKQKLEHRECH